MFICASTRSLPGQPLEEACERLADLGFDKFEICLGIASPSPTLEEIAADPDLFVSRVNSMTRLSPCAFTLLDDEVPLDHFKALMRACKSLRISQVTVPASPLGTPFNSEIDRLKRYVHEGQQEGVRVSIKTEKGRTTEDPRTAVELCQSVKGLGLTYDPSYYLDSSLGDQAQQMVIPHTFHLHLRDSRPGEVQVQVGLGEIDYSRIITQLQKHNYQRALSVEILPEYCDAEQIPLELRKLRMLLVTLL